MKIKKYLNPSGSLKPAQVFLNGKWVDLESHGDGNLSAGGRLFKVKTKPTSAIGNNEVVVTPKGATFLPITKDKGYKNEYRSAYHPEDAISFINTLTLGGLNNLSPTLWVRRAYDTKELLSGNMDWSNYTNSWINGNNGIVSDLFAEEHPYWSMAINGITDIATGGAALLPKTNFGQEMLARGRGIIDATKYGIYDRAQGYYLFNKYLKGKIPHIDNLLQTLLKTKFGPDVEVPWLQFREGLPQEANGIFLAPTTYTRMEYQYVPASVRMGFNPVRGTKLPKEIVEQGKKAIAELPPGTSVSADAHDFSVPTKLTTTLDPSKMLRRFRSNSKADWKQAKKAYESYKETAERAVNSVDDDAAVADPGSLTDFTYMNYDLNPYDMSADAVRFFTREAQKPGRALVYAGRSGRFNSWAVSNPQLYKWQEAYRAGEMSAKEYVENYNNWAKEFGGRPGHVDIHGEPYFYHPTVFITGHKFGGKAQLLKNGSGIHIKKKNRGKFTDYCGGKVTNACISRAKASGNPTLVKRATFAANARKWKH